MQSIPFLGVISGRACRNRNNRERVRPVYKLVNRRAEYVECGMEAHELRPARRTVSNLDRRAEQLGWRLARIAEIPDAEKEAFSVP
ncbi:MAG: hypothetical protein OXI87_06990 [Albidovulum sp.]|nr:hypothetical protein [Albidovulum sp.]